MLYTRLSAVLVEHLDARADQAVTNGLQIAFGFELEAKVIDPRARAREQLHLVMLLVAREHDLRVRHVGSAQTEDVAEKGGRRINVACAQSKVTDVHSDHARQS